MIEYDRIDNRMVLKLVYFGPALSGKTTNLIKLHDMLSREGRGDLMVLDTKDDRTIFFDLLPFFLVAPSGLKIKLKVYTVPGQVKHDATRKAVLQRADGVAFIADSRICESANNFNSFDNLEKNIAYVGLDIGSIPLVIQYNKRDLQEITPEEEIRHSWTSTGIPVFMATALYGYGVVETYTALLQQTYDQVNKRYNLCNEHGLDRDSFVNRFTTLCVHEST